ncbi:hypothetical protein [[Mycoplasma] mobile]|uniref:Expressed protein n=1 Tax=Mycoplasma mobile (strain ATCC 43663 / 163K / NCTC 11711) TaxID=267748 RepID=Q6KHR9_MYCM1|nr:hypothetical protein [[Mycoplasma] mobile]AAT27859.1 expressed protein [Mycoplasma mobile 163K]
MYRKKAISISEKIRYLAIGDDFSLGYSVFYSNQYPGYFKSEHSKKLGINFPSYLADIFLKNNDEIKLEWFENYSFLGARAKDVLYFLNSKKKDHSFLNSENIIKLNLLKDQDPDLSNVFKDDFKIKFNPNESEVKYENFNSLIQSANLITITLGFNDIFWDFPLEKILLNVFVSEKNNINLFWESFIKKQKDFKVDLFEVLKTLREKNPNAAIVYIIPPNFFFRLENILKVNYKNTELNLLNSINNNINKIVEKTISLFEDIYLINTFDKLNFEKNIKIYNRSPFDYHPTQIAYKKMAKDIFFKLSFPDNFSFEIAQMYKKNYSFNYFLSDHKNFRQILKYKKPLTDLYTNSNDEELESFNSEEKILLPFSQKIVLKKILTILFLVNEKFLYKYFQLLVSYLEKWNENLAMKIKFFLEENNNYIKLAKVILDSNLIEEIFQNIQNSIDFYPFSSKKIGDFLDLKIFKKIIIKNLSNKETYYRFLNYFYKDDFLKNNNSLIKNTFVQTSFILLNDQNLTKIFYEKFIESYVKNLSTKADFETVKSLYNLIVSSNSFVLFLKKLSSILFDHYLEFSKIDNYINFLANFSEKYVKQFLIDLFELFDSLLNTEKIKLEIDQLILNNFKYKIQEKNLLFTLWFLINNNHLKELIFKFLDYVSLELKYPLNGKFNRANIAKKYIKQNYKLFFKYLSAITESIKDFKDVKFLMYYLAKNPFVKKYLLNTRTFNSELNTLNAFDVFKSRKYLFRITRPFSSSLYEYCQENNDFETFENSITLLLNALVEIFEILSVPKNLIILKTIKNIIYKFLKTKSKQANLLIKSHLNKFNSFESIIIAIDKLSNN